MEIITVTEDGTAGEKGTLPDMLHEHADGADQVFACGPIAMYRAMAGKKYEKSVQISLGMRMGCGLGVCYGCTVRTKAGLKQVCKEGPVFALEDIMWDELARI